MKKIIRLRTLGAVVLFYLLVGCGSTYHVKSREFQQELKNGNTKAALSTLDDISFLKKKRNALLFYLEKGKVAYLNKDYALSNSFFNKADDFIELDKRDVGGKIIGTLLNPERETYLGEDFEKVAIHYYKALNYIFLNKFDDALVEARRINLQLQKINDSYPKGKKNRYSTDAFALNLQGMLYEITGNINDAFISYRNAVDLYLKNDGHFFGVAIPEQLKKDLLRTADIMGFNNDFSYYQKLFKTTYTPTRKQEGGEAIIFWENGLVPYKDQNFYAFTVLPGKRDGIATIYNKDLNLNIPLPINSGSNKKSEFSDIQVFNVAFPKYVNRIPYYTGARVERDSISKYSFELGQDYETVAFKTLKDRTLREIGKIALRVAVKKTSEYLLRDQNKDLGTILGIVNALTEKADTRNWQSLPNKISYARIPLKKGKNIITIQFLKDGNNTQLEKKIEIMGNGNIVFKSIYTL